MTKRTRDSVTEVPCTCGYLKRAASDPFSPIVFDVELNEYNYEYPDPEANDGNPESRASLRIYHCPFCGGAAPESQRHLLFAVVTPEEENRLIELLSGIRTVEQALKAFGPPTDDNPTGSSERRKLPDGSLGPVEVYRTLSYSNLSQTAEVTLAISSTGAIHVMLGGKYLGAPK